VTWEGSSGTLTGDLTIGDVTRPVTLDVEFVGAVPDPWGHDRAVFSANCSINRGGWGLTWNMALETGGFLVSQEIQLELHVELIREE
jgi:polyisoprenoid-binding protein YceI